METVKSLLNSSPTLSNFFPPTPQAYAALISVFQYFPIITTFQWLVPYHPAGKTSSTTSPSLFNLNLPGKPAWFAMEIISPVTLVYDILRTLPNHNPTTPITNIAALPSQLPLPNLAAASLFVLHYLNRAVVSPFLAAPSMSPIHLSVAVIAGLFNFVNASCLAGWVVGYSISVSSSDGRVFKTTGYEDNFGARVTGGWRKGLPYLGLVLFLVGMIGNIYSERRLFSLRKEEGEKRAEGKAKEEKEEREGRSTTTTTTNNINKYHKVYILPPARGIFHSILYPHYVFEWLEWLGYILVGTAVFPSRQSSISSSVLKSTDPAIATPSVTLVPWLVPFAVLAENLQVPLPLPAVMFPVNAIANMLPHARWGRKWYVDKFGESAVGRRGAVVPWCPWL